MRIRQRQLSGRGAQRQRLRLAGGGGHAREAALRSGAASDGGSEAGGRTNLLACVPDIPSLIPSMPFLTRSPALVNRYCLDSPPTSLVGLQGYNIIVRPSAWGLSMPDCHAEGKGPRAWWCVWGGGVVFSRCNAPIDLFMHPSIYSEIY